MFAATPGTHIPVPQQLFYLTFCPYLLEIGTNFFWAAQNIKK
jgi:hypothetical protein